jgi:hypothetical protein
VELLLFDQVLLDPLELLERLRLHKRPFSAIDSASPWVTIT